jgi:sugar lactone lactonase YvrE
MKKNYLSLSVLLCLFLSCSLFSQVTDVATTGLINPVGIAIKDNDMFISSVGNAAIRKKDLSDTSTLATTEYIPNLNFGIFIMFQGNDLYIPMLSANKVVKIDVTDPSANLIDVAINIDQPSGIAFRNNELFITSRSVGKIVKIDYTQTNPTPVDVITNIPNTPVDGMAFKGDELYFTNGGTISKINVTETTPTITDVLTDAGAGHIVIDGDFLYFSQPSNSKVSRINLTQSTPVAFDFLTFTQDPWGMIIDGNGLYIAEQNGDRVVRYDLATLGVDETSKETFTYYPNPTSDYLHIAGLKKNTSYILTDQQGKEVMSGTLATVDKLYLSNVASGVYFLKLNNYEVKKIVKY